MAKNKDIKPKNVDSDNKPVKRKISQVEPKTAPPEPVQLYQLEELGNGIAKINEALEKIIVELKIDSFVSLADYLEKLYEKIITQNDIVNKTLIFMDGITKFNHD